MPTPPDDPKPQPAQETTQEKPCVPRVALGFFITKLAVNKDDLLTAYCADREKVLNDPEHELSDADREALRTTDDGALRNLICFNVQVS